MSSYPGSYFVIDPGRSMGWASCLAGGERLKHGTWRFRQSVTGAVFAEFASYLRGHLKMLPDPLVVLELATIVSHGDDGRVDANQVVFSAGWPAIAHTICFNSGLREPDSIAIQTWRSKTHGKVTIPEPIRKANPKMTQSEKSAWFKRQATKYCDANGWAYNSSDEAEALCMLDAVRIIHEPGYAFERGRAHHQEQLF